MRIVIHQPYFIPWMGFFSKLVYADTYVCLDDVQFRKRHLFDRTKIINMHGQISWLNLPVGEDFGKNCNEITTENALFLNKEDYVEKILLTLKYSYSRAKYFENEWSDVVSALKPPLENETELVKINLEIIKNFLKIIGIKTPRFLLSSEISKEDFSNPTERILCICKNVGAESIIIGGGQGTNVHDWKRLQNENIRIFRQDFFSNHPKYYQSRRSKLGFARAMAIVDPIFNIGRESTRGLIESKENIPELVYF